MPTIKISLDQETYGCLSEAAVRELRPIPWHALVLLRGALGLPFPKSVQNEHPVCPPSATRKRSNGDAA
jgi:hypothetical protein